MKSALCLILMLLCFIGIVLSCLYQTILGIAFCWIAGLLFLVAAMNFSRDENKAIQAPRMQFRPRL